jgi:parallel beta-helix repeat protein
MKKIALVLLIIYQFLFPPHSMVYYVDSINGNDMNSGLSAENAWKTLEKVSSMMYSEGDRVLLKRGSVWYERLSFKGNGSSGNPVIISDYGEGELPVIDGSLIREQCMHVLKGSHIIISNIRMQNATRQGAIRIQRSHNIIVENCEFFITGHGGVFIENSENCIIRNNIMTTPSGRFNNQTDGIYSQRNNNITFDNNNIIISNEHPDQHCDGIQSYLDHNLIVKNNYIEQRNAKGSNAQGIYATNMQGLHIYYNNVVVCPNTRASVMGFLNLTEGRGSLKAYHNTLIGGGANTLYIGEDAAVDAKNNIFYTYANTSPVRLETSEYYLENNLYYQPSGGNVVSYRKGIKGRTLSELKAAGREQNGLIADPKLSDDYTLLPGSPCIDNGLYLGPPYDVDKSGVKRNSTPDIGAYEYVK